MSMQKLGSVVGAVFLFAVLGTVANSQQAKPQAGKVEHSEHNDVMQQCAKACSDCQRACDTCSTHCAHMLHAGQTEHMATLASCQDCADVCAAASQIVARGGPQSALICDSCAKACDQCAKACEKFPNDAHMKACAAECRKCEKACREMLKHVAAQ